MVVTTYGTLVRDAERLSEEHFATLVLDEAQAVKNPATRRARAARDLPCDVRFALSGTPIENHLGELWSVFRVVAPHVLGSWEHFRERFAVPIERDGNVERRDLLAGTIRPFVLRRTKRQVAPELPPRTEVTHEVSLSRAGRALYEKVRKDAVDRLVARRGSNDADRFAFLAALTKLRLLACDPGMVSDAFRGPSAKITALVELVREMREGGHQALVFSQFVKLLSRAGEALQRDGVQLLVLDGSTPEAVRRRRVDAFQRGEADVFLISLKAGGTGLDLTAADYVIHLDPWWNPAVEDQASDRAHRIGQTRPVTIYRLVARDTIEERVLALHADKRALADGVLSGTDQAVRLSTADLAELLRAPDGDRLLEEQNEEESDAKDEREAAPPQSPECPDAAAGPATDPSFTVSALRTARADFEHALESDLAAGRIARPATLRSYLRCFNRIIAFARRERLGGADPTEVAWKYADAAARGAHGGPASDATFAPTVARRLEAVL